MRAVRSVVVVKALPDRQILLEIHIVFVGQELMELVLVGSMRALDLSVELGCSWLDVNVLHALVSNIVEFQKIKLMKTQLPHLLRYEDRNSMAHSIESRLPVVDYRLVEEALSLPLRSKIDGGWPKTLLRKCAERHLPKEVSWRKNKFGFETPAHEWR